MRDFPDKLRRLIEELKKLPSIGEKTAEIVAFDLVVNRERLVSLIGALEEAGSLGLCRVCHTITEGEVCGVCSDESREPVLMIVESPMDMYRIEETGVFKGKYHVLGGLIEPLEGVEPSHLFIDDIPERIRREGIREVVFALSPTVEGDATMFYIMDLIKDTGVRITRIARGIPTGFTISKADEITLEEALKSRQPVE